MVAKFKLILAGIGAVLMLLIGAFFKGRSNGKAEVVAEVQERHNQDIATTADVRVGNVSTKAEVQQEAITSSDSFIDKELEDKWTRG